MAPNKIWQTDLSNLSAEQLLGALLAVRLLRGLPGLKAKLRDRDLLGAFWPLLQPVLRAQVVARCMTRPQTAGLDEDVVFDDEDEDEAPFEPQNDRRLRERLREWFGAVPRSLQRRLEQALAEAGSAPIVALLAKELGLDTAERTVLAYLELHQLSEPLRMLLRGLESAPARVHRERLSLMLALPSETLRATLTRKAPLRALGLVDYDGREVDLEDHLRPSRLLCELLDAAPGDGDALLGLLIEPAPPPAWRLEDFPHLARERAQLCEVLAEAARTGSTGVNALLYGAPGTGKTELARAVAAAAGLKAYQVRSADEDDEGLGRKGRLAAYVTAQHLLARCRDAVIIFDEIEDVFERDEGLLAMLMGSRASGQQKGWINRTLEDNPVPALWISNRTETMDPAFQRRFLVPVSCVTPPASVRRQMAERHLGEAGLSTDLLDELAADAKLAPAQLGAARRLLDLRPSTPPETAVREGVAGQRRLLHGAPAPRRRAPATVVDPDFLNLSGGPSPRALVAMVRQRGEASLCFYGPPGTGKTALAGLLADALDRELVSRRASDLLSPYVGETEQQLAELFQQGDPSQQVLLLDEVDSFLSDRRRAQHSWERVQVNELLQQMEAYPGIFIAATNLMVGIDPAALRRFDLKLGFLALSEAQRIRLFAREVFGAAEAPVPSSLQRYLQRLDGLTPGDFANVCRQQQLQGAPLSPEQFLRRLAAEWQLKGESTARAA
ncbi:MAG: AAA family ATPase [Lamprobacter sp.]|uniref:AAA family ATPase n=1 Tax=Lamprobacter sp. TaxID=3100796 RepID=UPI002B2632E1|nr:AAA family ATPase [Lamprobacter sp.]MEA3641542.1 AAA family ATPase [Lamprobacter sp.]